MGADSTGTDAALIAGMIHVMLEESLHDQAFLDKYCVGFDEAHMPEGAPKNASYRAYIEGKGEDGTEKTRSGPRISPASQPPGSASWHEISPEQSPARSPRAGARSATPMARTTPDRSSCWQRRPETLDSLEVAQAHVRVASDCQSPRRSTPP